MQRLHSPDEAARWLRARVRGTLQTDSRAVRAGDGFLAWPGATHDARRFVGAALAAGAAACLVETGVDTAGLSGDAQPGDGAVAGWAGLKAAAGAIAAAYFAHPSRAIDVYAVTGTNGKTSTAWWIAQALGALPQPRVCAVMGTLGIGVPPAVQPNGLTTPDAVLLQRSLRQLADQGVSACALEASSIGLAEHRLEGTAIRVAIFTNFTQDHLDYHGSMDAYWQAKARLFDWPGLQAAVINIDDPKGAALAANWAGRNDPTAALWTVSAQRDATLRAQAVRHHGDGLQFELVEGAQSLSVQTALVGDYNLLNLLGVIGALRATGVSLADAVAACGRLQPVPGRMQQVTLPGLPLVCVDYAHTPDALDKVLSALLPLARSRGGALWCVFGCGGDRDALKRPLMGAVAGRLAQRVVVTSDNPRSEDPQAIIGQILPGFGPHPAAQVWAEPDRGRAIDQCVRQADAADVIVLAGKGHESVQEIGGRRLPFSDLEQARAALARRGAQP